MNKLRVILSLILALALCFSMTACAEDKEDVQKQQGDNTQSNQNQEDGKQEENTGNENPPENQVQTPEEFFDNAAFIGDSVTLKLRNYDAVNNSLYGATFLCQGSYSVAHAVNDTMLLSYQGTDMTPQAALKACGADKVFILLGMNDIALWNLDTTMENWGKLIANIRSECPDIAIYIQSGTPIYLSGEVGDLTNANMDAYNARLQVFAQENGCVYVDVNTPFRSSAGGLAEAYCSDAFVHFTDMACKVWVEILMKQVNA